MLEVQEIIQKLKQKHGSKYAAEKYNAWAHMINMGKHGSYEDAPDYAYFGRKQKLKAIQSTPAATASSSTSENVPAIQPTPAASASSSSSEHVPAIQPSVNSSSPLDHINRRTECIDQLSKVFSLLDKGVITKEQYDTLQAKIMADM